LNTIKIMGYKVYCDDVSNIKLDSGKKIINTINAHSYIVAKNDPVFKDALKSSTILIPDGSGVVLAAKQLRHQVIKKIAGADMHKYLLEVLDRSNGKCFYMGASEKTLASIKKRLQKEYPNIQAEFYSPPYRHELVGQENQEVIDAINKFKPDVLFVGMTAPKQEKWVYHNSDKIDAKLFCTIGAVFDFYAGTVKRPSNFWIKNHLEWLPRFLKEPKRLWRRNLVSMPLFLMDMYLYKFHLKEEYDDEIY
jgi:N-acetylglucosaminyldiphosphoundecaprenol N-acetyl-beta-D-mannosaminyltransferase